MHGLPAGCHVCLFVKESKTCSLMDQDHIYGSQKWPTPGQLLARADTSLGSQNQGGFGRDHFTHNYYITEYYSCQLSYLPCVRRGLQGQRR